MAKSRRATAARTSARKSVKPKPAPRRTRPAAVAKPAPAPAAAAPPAAPARRPTYHEAVSMYERGLQALQRHDFATAAAALRNVIELFPDERELLERAGLYLKVCERELTPKEPLRSTDDQVYAATVALNAGDDGSAVQQLQRALVQDPMHHQAHYMMAVAMARRQAWTSALEHLRQAIARNPENRALARQDPDFEQLRNMEGFRAALETPSRHEPPSRPAASKAPRRSQK